MSTGSTHSKEMKGDGKNYPTPALDSAPERPHYTVEEEDKKKDNGAARQLGPQEIYRSGFTSESGLLVLGSCHSSDGAFLDDSAEWSKTMTLVSGASVGGTRHVKDPVEEPETHTATERGTDPLLVMTGSKIEARKSSEGEDEISVNADSSIPRFIQSGVDTDSSNDNAEDCSASILTDKPNSTSRLTTKSVNSIFDDMFRDDSAEWSKTMTLGSGAFLGGTRHVKGPVEGPETPSSTGRGTDPMRVMTGSKVEVRKSSEGEDEISVNADSSRPRFIQSGVNTDPSNDNAEDRSTFILTDKPSSTSRMTTKSVNSIFYIESSEEQVKQWFNDAEENGGLEKNHIARKQVAGPHRMARHGKSSQHLIPTDPSVVMVGNMPSIDPASSCSNMMSEIGKDSSVGLRSSASTTAIHKTEPVSLSDIRDGRGRKGNARLCVRSLLPRCRIEEVIRDSGLDRIRSMEQLELERSSVLSETPQCIYPKRTEKQGGNNDAQELTKLRSVLVKKNSMGSVFSGISGITWSDLGDPYLKGEQDWASAVMADMSAGSMSVEIHDSGCSNNTLSPGLFPLENTKNASKPPLTEDSYLSKELVVSSTLLSELTPYKNNNKAVLLPAMDSQSREEKKGETGFDNYQSFWGGRNCSVRFLT